MVLLVDLGHFDAANFHLQDWSQEAIPEHVLAVEPPVRYAEVRAPGRLSASEIRYSKSVPLAIGYRRSMLGTNDGGVLPGGTEHLFRALDVNTRAALAASACDYEYQPTAGAWQPVTEALPRCRFAPEGAIDVMRIPLESVTLPQVLSANLPLVRPTIMRETARDIEIEVDAPVAGILVVADTFYPGWEAVVDGKPRPIEPVHGVFRGVPIKAGRHRVAMSYRPDSFRVGCYGSLSGAALALALGAVAFRSKARNASTDSDVKHDGPSCVRQ